MHSTPKPNRSNYHQISTLDDYNSDSNLDATENSGLLTSPKQPRLPHGRIDIQAQIEKWSDKIASKFKPKKGHSSNQDRPLEIQLSVFQPPDWIQPPQNAYALATQFQDPPGKRMTKDDFDRIVEKVRLAIEMDIHPTLISQGSSGSYFARDSSGRVVGVFKPKDEEPYASRNPKWTKWIHRNLFPFFFGRACLIPNLSYVSEAAAYVLDRQLRTNVVPYTDVVSLSSKSFHYDFWDRHAFRRGRSALPEKPGSFQVFLTGYKDATAFFKDHPWPDQISRDGPNQSRSTGPTASSQPRSNSYPRNQEEPFWTPALQASFREQLERLVILDYIMRNTDRGLDNWMIRIDRQTERASIVSDPPQRDTIVVHTDADPDHEQGKTARSKPKDQYTASIGAIDNSLSWPWKHPDAWRSYPFGWLFLPSTLIGKPFSEATRRHFLPLLTSTAWWTETKLALRRCFKKDEDFQEKMFAKQMAVIKGQAWNVVETLKIADHGPLELTRRSRVCVWDDLVEVPSVVPISNPVFSNRSRFRPKDWLRSGRPSRSSWALEMSDDPDRLEYYQASAMDVRNPHRPEVGGGRLSGSNANVAQSAPDRPGMLSRESVDNDMSDLGPAPPDWASVASDLGGALPRPPRASQFQLDDLSGDLGYATNEHREPHRRKVIVERLEVVKGKPPIFSWC